MRVIIESMKDGGYLVGGQMDLGYPSDRMFACTKLEDALKYIGDVMTKETRPLVKDCTFEQNEINPYFKEPEKYQR